MAINHQDNFETNPTSAISVGATTSPLNNIPSIDAPFYLAFDAENANGHYEVAYISSKTATNVNHAALTYAHSIDEIVRMVVPATELDGLQTTKTNVDTNLGDGTSVLGMARQAIMNGNFDVWQRGTTVALTTTNNYTADRFYAETSTATDYKTISRQDGTGVLGSNYCARIQRPSGRTTVNPIILSQALETTDSIKLRGKKLTLSFWARKGANFSAASDVLVAKIVTGKGTNQKLTSFTTSADAVSENKTLTEEWQKFTITTPDAIASDITQIGIRFSFSPVGTASTNDYFEIAQMQLCVGEIALPFQPNSFEEELRACQRYYETGTTEYLNYVSSGVSGLTRIFFKVTKRVTPTVTQSNIANSNFGTGTNQGTLNDGGFSSYRAATGTGSGSFAESWTANADL